MREKGSRGNRLPREKLVSGKSLTTWVPELVGEPVPPRQRRLTPIEQQQLRAQTTAWLHAGVVEREPRIVWVNNPVMVAKKNGAIRVCIDCTPANRVTKDYDWPLPRLQDVRHHVAGASWFSRLDLKDAFFRISIPVAWRELTAFECDNVKYQFKRMPFGLKTAPAVFQRFMDHTLSQFKPFCFWYIDDILVHASTLKELRIRTRQVKDQLKNQGHKINEDKSEYEKRGLLFAGVWVYGGGTGPNLVKVRDVLALAPPRTKPELQSALGLVSYLRDHIPLASFLTAALNPKKDEPINLQELAALWRRLLEHVRHAITTLAPWNESEDANLYTDSSGYATAAVLIQNGRIVALASRKLTPAETRYSATDREHLSLALAATRFKLFLHRRRGRTQVWNDHEALLNRKIDDMSPRQCRTWEAIGQWIPNLRHVPGKSNPADFFSRCALEINGGQIRV